jgi:hypothetical protein
MLSELQITSQVKLDAKENFHIQEGSTRKPIGGEIFDPKMQTD